MSLVGDDRLIGLGRDDGFEYVEWIRHAISDICAHIPHYAHNNAAALKKLSELSSANASLDFITTDIVNVSASYDEGIQFVRSVRALSNDLLISNGLRLKHIPIIVFTGGGYRRENIDLIHAIDSSVPVVSKLSPNELPRQLIEAVTRYRHKVLEDFQKNGHAIYWEAGRLRLCAAYSITGQIDSQYFSGSNRQFPGGYSRLVLITGQSSISYVSLEEFEDLLNAKSTREEDFQSFFERNPEFLLGDEYDSYWAEPRLRSPSTGQIILPDFVLQPLALREHPWRWNVVDLKRHDIDLLIEKKFHVDLSRHVYRAATQLKDYAEFFADPRNANEIQRRFGVVPNPQLTMVIGRLPEADRAAFNRLQGRISGVYIRTYDEILQFRRARLERLHRMGI